LPWEQPKKSARVPLSGTAGAERRSYTGSMKAKSGGAGSRNEEATAERPGLSGAPDEPRREHAGPSWGLMLALIFVAMQVAIAIAYAFIHPLMHPHS